MFSLKCDTVVRHHALLPNNGCGHVLMNKQEVLDSGAVAACNMVTVHTAEQKHWLNSYYKYTPQVDWNSNHQCVVG